MDRLANLHAQGDPMDECQSNPHVLDSEAKDLNVLADIYWVVSFLNFIYAILDPITH